MSGRKLLLGIGCWLLGLLFFFTSEAGSGERIMAQVWIAASVVIGATRERQ